MQTTLTLSLAGAAFFGLAAGASPGPLMAVAVDRTLRNGLGAGLRIALVPLITDGVVIAVTWWLLSGAARQVGINRLLFFTAITGAVFLIWLATKALRQAARDEPDEAQHNYAEVWREGLLVNWLSPNPWLFWLTLGSPYLLAHSGQPWRQSLFLGLFYGTLLFSKSMVVLLVHRHRHRPELRGKGIRRLTAAVFFAFAGKLLWDASQIWLYHLG